MEESLISLLMAYAPLQALIGSNPARVYWVRAPQGVMPPYVTLQVISGNPDVSHEGPNGLVEARVQADCYGLTYGSAKTVSRAVTDRLSGFKGTRNTTVFGGIFKDGERDGYDDEESPDKLFRVSMDFMIWHKGT